MCSISNMKKYFAFSVLTFISCFTLSWSQGLLDLAEETNGTSFSATSNDVPPVKLVQHLLEVCYDQDDNSKTYCKCEGGVVNCDFTNYLTKHKNDTMELTVSGFGFPETTRRVCFCNTPDVLNLNFGKDFLPKSNIIHRFDFYNLKGLTKLDTAFSYYFNGDLYIANVSMIPDIHRNEFGRGADEIENLQEFGCCSPIKVNQGYKKPLLFIENTTIHTIYQGGISALHLWNTIIFKTVNVNKIMHFGFTSNNARADIAIMDSTFSDVEKDGINFDTAANLFMAKTYFKRNTSDLAWTSRSTLNASNVVLLANKFWNGVIFSIDAERIVSWHNQFLDWDNYTFSHMKKTSFNQRFISIKYNTIDWAHNLTNDSFQFGSQSQVVLKENVLGTCSCSQVNMYEDATLKREVNPINRCFAGNISDPSSGQCSLLLDAAMKACAQSSTPNFNDMCRDKSIGTNSTFPGFGTDVLTDVEKARVNSTFITTIVNEYRSLVGVKKIATVDGFLVDSQNTFQDDENPKSGGNSGHQTSSDKHGSATMTVIITLTVLVIVCAMVIIGYRNRHRFIGRNHQRLDASREVFI